MTTPITHEVFADDNGHLGQFLAEATSEGGARLAAKTLLQENEAEQIWIVALGSTRYMLALTSPQTGQMEVRS